MKTRHLKMTALALAMGGMAAASTISASADGINVITGNPIISVRSYPPVKTLAKTDAESCSATAAAAELDVSDSNDVETEQYSQPEEPDQAITEENNVEIEQSEAVCSYDPGSVEHGDEHDLTYLGEWTTTAYCGCEICNGQWTGCNTASGTVPTQGRTVACNSLPFGTEIVIGEQHYIVEDTGYTPYGEQWIDIYFDDHQEALDYGVRTVPVSVWE